MAIVDINIVKASANVCIADQVQLNPGDTARWVNQTGDSVILFFPHEDVFGKGSKHFFATVPDKASHHPAGAATKKNPAGPAEKYTYVIFCRATNRFAVGGSDPEIIVM